MTFPYDRQAVFARAVTRANLMAAMGNVTVTLSSSNTNSYDKQYVKLRQYLDYVRRESLQSPVERRAANETFYLFGDTTADWTQLFSLFRPQTDNFEFALSFGVGGDRSGVQYHLHGPVFAETVAGFKRWALTAPTRDGEAPPAFDPNMHAYDFFQQQLYPPNTFDCTLGPGEVLFIPDLWWHATLNIGETVFVSMFA